MAASLTLHDCSTEEMHMAKRKRVLIVSILIGAFVIGFSHVRAESNDLRMRVPHISASKALKLFMAERLILVDVHPGKNKVRSSIVGALYIPAGKIEKIKLKIPNSMLLGVFCN